MYSKVTEDRWADELPDHLHKEILDEAKVRAVRGASGEVLWEWTRKGRLEVREVRSRGPAPAADHEPPAPDGEQRDPPHVGHALVPHPQVVRDRGAHRTGGFEVPDRMAPMAGPEDEHHRYFSTN